MDGWTAVRLRGSAGWILGLVPVMLLGASGVALADAPEPLPAPQSSASPAAAGLTLEACRQIALEHQPAVAAARANLDVAVLRARAVEHLHVPTLLAHDLPVRRKQAALGVTAAEGILLKTETDTRYSVAFCYLSAVFALQQQGVAREASDNLKDLYDAVADALKAGRRDVTTADQQRIAVYREVVQARREEADAGAGRALSALREAMGVGPDCPLVLAHHRLYAINPPVDRHQVVALALASRGELVQAAAFVEVTDLEIAAQQSLCGPSGRTFAGSSDIHAQPIPAGSYDENYRPAALAPEMPATLVGSRCDRVAQARAYNARAEAVANKTRNLIVLEAEQAYLRWEEASRKLPHHEKAAQEAETLANQIRKQFNDGKGTLESTINARNLAGQLRAQANQTRYQMLLALAMLERVTAGGFCAGFEVPAPVLPPNGDAR
jgi:outer membrane protein TolC